MIQLTKGQIYYYINIYGQLTNLRYRGSSGDLRRIKAGNAFVNRMEANKVADMVRQLWNGNATVVGDQNSTIKNGTFPEGFREGYKKGFDDAVRVTMNFYNKLDKKLGKRKKFMGWHLP